MPAPLRNLLKWTEVFFTKNDLKRAKLAVEMACQAFPSSREARRARFAVFVHMAAADWAAGVDRYLLGGRTTVRGFLRSATRSEADRRDLRDLLDPAKSRHYSAVAASAYQFLLCMIED
jgi:hypothetical protein